MFTQGTGDETCDRRLAPCTVNMDTNGNGIKINIMDLIFNQQKNNNKNYKNSYRSIFFTTF